MVDQARNESIDAPHRHTLSEIDWEDIREPGCYVDEANGDLYRVPKEALREGSSPLVTRESYGASRMVQISRDPFTPSLKARLLCAKHNIQPNF